VRGENVDTAKGAFVQGGISAMLVSPQDFQESVSLWHVAQKLLFLAEGIHKPTLRGMSQSAGLPQGHGYFVGNGFWFVPSHLSWRLT
jgi:hypothetical protein